MAQSNYKDDRFLAEIPWIERPIGDKRLEDTNFYKGIGEKCPWDEKNRRLQFFWMINETFPFYLPQRYHAMDCLALHKNSKDGNYWANASVFLYNTTAYGHRFLADVVAFLKLGKPDLKYLSQSLDHYKAITQKYLKNNLEESKSAAEFLLDPWVLLKIPLQPMIAYQWAVALLTEAFKLEKDISEMKNLAFKAQLKVPIVKLEDMHLKMVKFSDLLLGVFLVYFQNGYKKNYHKCLQIFNLRCKDFLIKDFPEILPITDFVLSQEFRDVIISMKKLVYKSSFIKDQKEVWFCETEPCVYKSSVFNSYHSFWNYEGKMETFRAPTSFSSLEFKKDRKEKRTSQQWLKFVDEKILQTGILQVPNRDNIFAAARYLETMLRPYFEEYLDLEELLKTTAGHHKTGIIYNMITLKFRVNMAACLSYMTRFLLTAIKPDGNLTLEDVDGLGPKYSLRQVSDILSSVQPDKKWSYQNILKRVKNSFDEKLMEFPDFDQGAERIAIHLQERIRRIVLKMIDRQYDSFKEEEYFLYYPECQFVQLILPCFVASFLDLDKDPSASQETKRKYFEFVHQLVKTYETTEFSNKITTHSDAVPFSSIVHQGFNTTSLQDRCKSVDTNLRQLLSNSKIYNAFFSKGMSSNFYVDSLSKSENDDDYRSRQINWSQMVFMFNSRMRVAMRKIGFLDDPELTFNEKQHFLILGDGIRKTEKERIWVSKAQQFLKFVNKYPDFYNIEMLKLHASGVPVELVYDARKVSESNLEGLLLYFLVRFHAENMAGLDEDNDWMQGPGFPIDPTDSVLWYNYTKDMWKLKLELANIFTLREGNEDPALISFADARSNLCYKPIMKFISPEGKVDMNHPGEITLFPVKHCRWCGRVKAKEFRVCPVCAETPDYPDLNFFCSEICEKEALQKKHEEEHINFLMQQCGIDN